MMLSLRNEQAEIVKVFKRVFCINVIALSVLTGLIQTADNSYGLTNDDTLTEAEAHLEQAALDSPQRHKQDTIQRDVHDVIFLLDQSWKAAKKSDDVARRDYAQQALTLLQRSAARGYFDLARAEPVLVLIRQLLSDHRR